jgi:hypothetical protein
MLLVKMQSHTERARRTIYLMLMPELMHCRAARFRDVSVR